MQAFKYVSGSVCENGEILRYSFLLSGLKNNWLSKEISLMAAVFLSNVKYYHKLLERLTAGLYKAYPEMKILEALCSLLIRGDQGPFFL